MINKTMLDEKLFIKEYNQYIHVTNHQTTHFTKYMNLYSCNNDYGDLEIKGECIIKLKEYQKLVRDIDHDYLGELDDLKDLAFDDDDFVKLEFMIELNNDINQKDDYLIKHKIVTPLKYKLNTHIKYGYNRRMINSNLKRNYTSNEVQQFIIDMFNKEQPINIKLLNN